MLSVLPVSQSIVGAVLVLLLGLGFAVWLNRRSYTRCVEYEDLDGLVEG